MSIGIKATVRRLPSAARRMPFDAMVKKALGKNYDLSLVICGDALVRAINKKYRRKTYAANVLSFPLDKNEGEIFLNVRAAQREAKKCGVSTRERLALLFVHGLFHLKGWKHGDNMEGEERKVLKNFGF